MPSLKHDLEIKGFIFDGETGHTYNVNPAGFLILKELIAETPLREIRDKLQDKYGISRKVASMDLDDFLRQLLRLELIESDEVVSFD